MADTIPTCPTCNLPYQAGRKERHDTTYSHRAAVGTAPRRRPARPPRKRARAAARSTAPRARQRPARAPRPSPPPAAAPSPALESFGSRMARLKAARAAGSPGS